MYLNRQFEIIAFFPSTLLKLQKHDRVLNRDIFYKKTSNDIMAVILLRNVFKQYILSPHRNKQSESISVVTKAQKWPSI